MNTAAGLTLAMLISGSAWAQQSPTSTPAPGTPPAKSDEVKSSDMPKSTLSSLDSKVQANAGNVSFVDKQQKNEMLASGLKGLAVKNSMDEPLGTISDFVTSDDGKIHAVLVRVGGFMGLGASDILVTHESVTLGTDKDGIKLAKLETTREVP